MPGNNWERMKEQNLLANQPRIVEQLEEMNAFHDFLVAQVWDAMMFMERLVSEGTPSSTAEELALAHLFPEQS